MIRPVLLPVTFRLGLWIRWAPFAFTLIFGYYRICNFDGLIPFLYFRVIYPFVLLLAASAVMHLQLSA
jgi:hypothetical protein